MSSYNHYRDANERQRIKVVEDENVMIDKWNMMDGRVGAGQVAEADAA